MGAAKALDKASEGAKGFETVGKVIDKVGKATGIVSVIKSTYEAVQNPTTGNILKATLDITLVAAKVNPLIGVAAGFLDVSGAKDAMFRKLDQEIDTFQSNRVLDTLRVDPNRVNLQ
ncbi:hypothetical protein GCM10022407_12960 [Hymenobacter antarcticus]|uniref:Uncharacterized protein n=2 Tax=Hymenobacter antarcticus TaxID=486270 RepID=A0ABP7PMV9_9BACT